MSLLLEKPVENRSKQSELIQGLVPQSQTDSLKEKIVIFENRIFILVQSSILIKSSYYGYDYFEKKIAETTEPQALFHIDTNKKELRYFRDNITIQSAQLYKLKYEQYMKEHIDITGKSHPEVCEIHKDIIKKRIEQQLLRIPSKDKIRQREDIHREYIRKTIDKSFIESSDGIYEFASKAEVGVLILFTKMSEDYVTQFGEAPRYIGHPCADGVLRTSYKEYVYYLMEELFKSNKEEHLDDPQLWIASHLVDRMQRIYPHLKITYKQTKDIMPTIILYFNVDAKLSLH
jgi:hypothetical protein